MQSDVRETQESRGRGCTKASLSTNPSCIASGDCLHWKSISLFYMKNKPFEQRGLPGIHAMSAVRIVGKDDASKMFIDEISGKSLTEKGIPFAMGPATWLGFLIPKSRMKCPPGAVSSSQLLCYNSSNLGESKGNVSISKKVPLRPKQI